MFMATKNFGGVTMTQSMFLAMFGLLALTFFEE